MKTFLACGAAAIALVGLAPALAQVGQTAPQAQAAPRAAKTGKVHTRAEVQSKVAEHFARLDSNRDGFVTKAEADAVRSQLREKMSERMAEHRGKMFERMDSNGDGSISRAEFDAMHAQRRQRAGGDRKESHRGGGMRHMGMIGGRMFEAADANNDGRVSLEEATAVALRHFDMADTDRDGRITADERRQMHQRMINERHPG